MLSTYLKRTTIAVAILAAFGLGLWLASEGGDGEGTDASAAEANVPYTCSMHPNVRQMGPGKCPICGMDLIPVAEEEAESGATSLTLSERARERAGVETAPVAYRQLTHQVRTVGKVAFDERRLTTSTAWVPGRIERLFVDYTGIRVRRGDHLVEIYSPELRTAEAEYLWAWRQRERTGGSERLLEAARERLLLWGITPEQIEELEESGEPRERVTIHAPRGGTVIEKMIFEGQYVETGDVLYRIADLSQVWVMIDVYEQDLPWIRYGQTIQFEAEAFPGETFEGRVAFIDPVVDEETRTVDVRLNVDNSDRRLKPGMFVRARVDVQVDRRGRVIAPEMAGRWICPMHPEEIDDEPGSCSICGMDLEPAGEHGYAPEGAAPERTLSIPYTAPLVTGERAIVYVEEPNPEGRPGTRLYTPREIQLGPRAGDRYVVTAGLLEGERIARRGTFKIDAAMQILARPSMMLPDRLDGVIPTSFREQVGRLVVAYLDVAEAVAAGDRAGIRETAAGVREALSAVDGSLVTRETRETWDRGAETVGRGLERLATAGDPSDVGAGLVEATEGLAEVVGRLGHVGPDLRYLRDPTARGGRGATWLQSAEVVRNPYRGAGNDRFREGRLLIRIPSTAPWEPEPEALPEDAVPAAFREQLGEVTSTYLEVQSALASDEAEAASAAATSLEEALAAVDMSLLEGEAHRAWMRDRDTLIRPIEEIRDSGALPVQREAFGRLSTSLVPVLETYGHRGPGVSIIHCPMAFDGEGADWLQRPGETRNPYYGAEMPGCGDEEGRIEPVAADDGGEEE